MTAYVRCGWGDSSTVSCAAGLTRRVPAISACSRIIRVRYLAGVRRIEAVTGEGAIAMSFMRRAISPAISLSCWKGDSNNLAIKFAQYWNVRVSWKRAGQQLKEQAAAQESANLPAKQLRLTALSCWSASLAVWSRKCCVPWLTIKISWGRRLWCTGRRR